jgi:pyruvate dehydrogenase E2 component (dihydrolipoamide acetyltransferase)
VAGLAELETAHVVRACALALVEHPRANGAYRDGHFELYSRINVGLVLALEGTYLIPTVLDADHRSLDELRREVGELQSGAFGGRLTPPAFSGATFTAWNAGELGIAQASLPVVPPQAAVLVAGTNSLTLSCDHRILYGAAAAGFLAAVSRRLSEEGG